MAAGTLVRLATTATAATVTRMKARMRWRGMRMSDAGCRRHPTADSAQFDDEAEAALRRSPISSAQPQCHGDDRDQDNSHQAGHGGDSSLEPARPASLVLLAGRWDRGQGTRESEQHGFNSRLELARERAAQGMRPHLGRAQTVARRQLTTCKQPALRRFLPAVCGAAATAGAPRECVAPLSTHRPAAP